jgi:endonuclease YncB( thermonuclease family)|tara:strand:- start:318 stop:896 length:579 start_codon:yes stop_codon:yes gene_type:complete
MNFSLFFLISFFIFLSYANSHSGRTNSEGCHKKTSNNTYHCHNKKSNYKNNSSTRNFKVIDGDTISINNVSIRFSGIDAPESYYRGKDQKCLIGDSVINCGKLSKNFLIKLIGKKKVECKLEKKPDQYNRKLGECFVENKSLSRLMVKNGYAFDYPKYSKKKFAKEQVYAKENKLGLWSMKFQFPWDFRKNN